MKFIFDFQTFYDFYSTPGNLRKCRRKQLTFFNKQYARGDYRWVETTQDVTYMHPKLDMYMSSNAKYIFFNIPFTVNGKHYANHFSIGLKDTNVRDTTKTLLDIHYTNQDPIMKQSGNSQTKCWLYDGIELDTTAIDQLQCRIPNTKRMRDVYTDEYIAYLNVILSTPFVQT